VNAAGRAARVQHVWIGALLLAGALLRLALFRLSPPSNAFDDHLSAIAAWAARLARPAADACWQCYQPPAYYALSAGVLRVVAWLSGDNPLAWRAVQGLSLLFSVAALVLAWRILALAGARSFAPRACALAVLVFLPRDVYTAVFISNDAMLGFAVTLAILVYLEALARGRECEDARWLLALVAAATLAAWTKQHGLIVALLPVAWVYSERQGCLAAGQAEAWRRRRRSRAVWLSLGLLVIASDALYQLVATGHWLVSNQHYFDWPRVQRPGSVAATSFHDLRILTLLREPTLSRASIDSFWTQLFARLWFDYDPKFLVDTWVSRALAAAWYTLGLGVGLVWLLGLVRALRRWRAAPPRLVLAAVQLAFLAVPLAQSLRFPHYSSMKATFFLPAASISAVWLSFGFERLWRWRAGRVLALVGCAAFALLFAWELVLIREQIHAALVASWRGGKLWPYPPGFGTR
jgi:hypothetical protein